MEEDPEGRGLWCHCHFRDWFRSDMTHVTMAHLTPNSTGLLQGTLHSDREERYDIWYRICIFFLLVHSCMYSISTYKQSEVWTMEVVDMTHLPLWGGCVMSAHCHTLSNLIQQAVYALLPARLITLSNFIHMSNTIHTSHSAPRPLTPTHSHMVKTTGPAFMHGVATLCTLNTSPHLVLQT